MPREPEQWRVTVWSYIKQKRVPYGEIQPNESDANWLAHFARARGKAWPAYYKIERTDAPEHSFDRTDAPELRASLGGYTVLMSIPDPEVLEPTTADMISVWEHQTSKGIFWSLHVGQFGLPISDAEFHGPFMSLEELKWDAFSCPIGTGRMCLLAMFQKKHDGNSFYTDRSDQWWWVSNPQGEAQSSLWLDGQPNGPFRTERAAKAHMDTYAIGYYRRGEEKLWKQAVFSQGTLYQSSLDGLWYFSSSDYLEGRIVGPFPSYFRAKMQLNRRRPMKHPRHYTAIS